MQEEFTEDIPNARAMVKDVSIPEALEYKKRLASVKGVDSVTWLDDNIDITTPIDFIDQDILDAYYAHNAAIYNIVIDEDYYVSAVAEIRDIVGENNAVSGNAVFIADSIKNTELEAQVTNIEKIIAQLEKNNDGITRAENIARNFISQLNAGISKLNNGTQKLKQSYDKFDEGLKAFMRTVAQLSNLKKSIKEAISSYERSSGEKLTYETAVAKIVAGYNAIVSGTTQLASGGQMLADGTHQLRAATSNLDVQVEDKITSLLDSIKGNAHIGSFASSNNTQVEAVQFAIKTAKVAKNEDKTVK